MLCLGHAFKLYVVYVVLWNSTIFTDRMNWFFFQAVISLNWSMELAATTEIKALGKFTLKKGKAHV